MATIGITGMGGFIGFHLAKKLHGEGHDVVGFDSFNNYYDPMLKSNRASNLHEKTGITTQNVDLKNREELDHWMKKRYPDLIIHLAAYAGVRNSMDCPEDYIQNNVVGTHNLIESCKKYDIDKVVFASTSCVMAGNELPWKEDEKVGYPLNPYGYTKLCNESQFMASTIPTTIGLRFFTVYGEWGRPDMALFDFTNKIIRGEEIDLFNHGDMIRDFTYVGDIVNGINIVTNLALESDNTKDMYNIGNGRQVPLMEFVENIEFQLQRKAIKNFVPKHPADTQATWSDTTKLQALGYKAETPIEEGVEKFITWYKGYYNVN
jgi:UDP-glucuronate 4-epimerase|tara:strand:- start:221 stop:1177 length:957 start_codon:yes stop_codon:yes gene_type:complete